MWIIFTVIFVLISTTNSTEHLKIRGGRPAALGEFPMQAVLVNSSNWQLLCSGSLISKRTILTAAHCLVGCDRKCLRNYRAIVGDITLQKTEISPLSRKIYKLRQSAVNERFQLTYIRKDIAIVQILGNFRVSNYVDIATLAKKQPAIGTLCTITGYGFTETGMTSEVLLATEVSVLDDNVCRNSFPGFDADTMICAGNTTNINSPCNGDSGGPLLCGTEKIQVGIVSLGNSNCAGGVLYTDVAAYADWITEHEAAMLTRKGNRHSTHKSKANRLFDEIFLMTVVVFGLV